FTYCAGISRASWPSPPSRRLHKKSIFCTKSPPLVELYVQSPHHERAAFRFGQANQSCVRSSQMLAPRLLNTRRLGHTPKPSPPVERTLRLGRGGMGFNKRRIAREGARSSRSGTFRAFFSSCTGPPSTVANLISNQSRFLWLTCNA